MRTLSRAERLAVGVWIVLTLVVWNGVYDLLMTRGIKDYLLRNALHMAGRGPAVSMTALLDYTIDDAFWLSTLWASATLFAGLWTVRLLGGRGTSHVPQGSGGPTPPRSRSATSRLARAAGAARGTSHGDARGTSHVARRT